MKGTVKARGKNTWRLRYDGPAQADGTRRQVTETIHGSKEDADAVLRARLSGIDKGGFVEPTTATVSEYLKHWLVTYAATNTTARTVQGYTANVNRYMVPAIGNIRLQKLQPGQVQKMYADLLGRGLGARTVLHVHRVLREALHHAVRWEMVARNVCDAVTPPRPERTEAPVWDDVAVKLFLEAAESNPYRDFFYLALLTGARRSELCGLRWLNVDLSATRLMVRETRQRITGKGIIVGVPKTGKSRRTVILDDVAVKLLHAIRGRQLSQAAEYGAAWENTGYVFTQVDGKPIDPDVATQQFAKVVKDSRLPHLTLHGLRHVHATRLLQRGVHAKIVSERLGHATIAITLDTYSHVLPGLQEAAIRQLGSIFG